MYNLFYASFSVPFGRLSDRIGRKNVLVIGFLLFALTASGFAFVANNITIWVLFALYGLFMAVTDGVSKAYVSDMVSEKERATSLGVYHTIIGVMLLPANLLGGLLWQRINVQSPFIFASALALVSAFLLMVLIRKKE